MFVQFIRFETSLSEAEAIAVARNRLPTFQALPGLVQKLYLKLDQPNQFGGFYIWESREAMMAFRQSDLAKSIPAAFKVVGAPKVEFYDFMFALREQPALPTAA